MGYPHARHATFSELGAEENLHGFAVHTCPQQLACALGILPGGDGVPTIVDEDPCETDKAGHLCHLCQDAKAQLTQLINLAWSNPNRGEAEGPSFRRFAYLHGGPYTKRDRTDGIGLNNDL